MPTQPPASDASNPFGASTSQMFNDFERAKTEQKQSESTPNSAAGNNSSAAGADIPGIPGMGEGDLGNLEKQFMGMFQNIAKSMENMEDGEEEDDDDQDLTEEEKKEAENMMKNIFGAMGMDPNAAGAGGMPGMPGMPGMGMPGMGMPGMPAGG